LNDEQVASGGQFGFSETTKFPCVGSNTEAPVASPIESPISSPTESPVASPSGFVRISRFEVKQKIRDNGKLKTKLKFAVKTAEGERATGSVIKVQIDFGDIMVEVDECTVREIGRCTVRLPAYHPDDYGAVLVSVNDISSTHGAYDPNLNKEVDECPLFSSQCVKYPIN